MSEPPPQENVTRVLQRIKEGDQAGVNELFDLVYGDLRRFAAYLFESRNSNTLQPTALVNEAYVRLVKNDSMNFENRRHFFDVASMAMRQLLTDHIRKRDAVKRGGGQDRVALEAVASKLIHQDQDVAGANLAALDAALTELESLDPRQGKIVRLHFFAGSPLAEIAEFLDVTPRTVQRDWQMARVWLSRCLQKHSDQQ